MDITTLYLFDFIWCGCNENFEYVLLHWNLSICILYLNQIRLVASSIGFACLHNDKIPIALKVLPANISVFWLDQLVFNWATHTRSIGLRIHKRQRHKYMHAAHITQGILDLLLRRIHLCRPTSIHPNTRSSDYAYLHMSVAYAVGHFSSSFSIFCRLYRRVWCVCVCIVHSSSFS